MDYFKIPQRLKTPRSVTYWAGLLLWTLANCIVPTSASSQDSDHGFKTPNSVEGELAETAERQRQSSFERYFKWKKQLEENTGLRFGIDTHAQYLGANVNGDTTDSATNVFRFYGIWTATGRSSPNNGALVFKIENRSALGGLISTQALGPEVGYAGVFSSTYSDAGWVLTNLYWRQRLLDSRLSFVIGQVDNFDYVNVNSLASPWIAFTNLAFEQQPTYPGPGQGLGAALQWRLNDNWAVLGGFANANGNAAEPVESARQLFQSGETFKHFAIGWSPDWGNRYDQLVQLTLWQADEREEAGVEGGYGVAFASSARIDKWRPFLRAGYANDAGAVLDRAVSVGIGYDARGGKDLAGLAVGWGRAPENSRDQFTLEGFYRYDVTGFLQLTPSVQYVANPANDPATDNILVFGSRLRIFF